MISIPKIKKKVEKFFSSEEGLVSKRKLLSSGVAVAFAGMMLKDNFVSAKSVHVNNVYSQADFSRSDVVEADATLCTVTPTSAHVNCSDHDNWGDGHASCSAGGTTAEVAKKCYSHSDNFVPSVATDGKTVQMSHSHAYTSRNGLATHSISGDSDGSDPWK